MLTDYHLHLRSDDTDASVEEHFTQANVERYRAVADDRGSRSWVSPSTSTASGRRSRCGATLLERYAHDDLDSYCAFVREQTDLRLGIEADFVPGREDRMAISSSRDFDYSSIVMHFMRDGPGHGRHHAVGIPARSR